jgi:FkbM family methyltransferase
MTSTITLTLVDNVKIIVPNSLNLITPYVLMEQQDWFEDEIKFLRKFLQPGQKIIDIGANYGVYTLSMAKAVGTMGQIWAFEPTSNTANLLAEGISLNNFTQIVLNQSALSNTAGTAQLSLNENSELNALVHDDASTSMTETVSLVTLDQCLEDYNWEHIDFIKIDAEGEETNILQGGKKFFAKFSPLVQYEIKAGSVWHGELVQDFIKLGYDSYRLVPGLNLLIPFDMKSSPDGYLLNLFCCQKDRAQELVNDGFLLTEFSFEMMKTKEFKQNVLEKVKNGLYDWHHVLTKLPYGIELAEIWQTTMMAGKNSYLETALAWYLLSRDSSVSMVERFFGLEISFNQFKNLCVSQPPSLHLASLARVAQDYGARTIAVQALNQLSNQIFQSNQVNIKEPFLTPGERFDSISPNGAIGNWVLASILEEFESLSAFSSFYTGASARQRLDIIQSLGFGSAEMERRLWLLKQRFAS